MFMFVHILSWRSIDALSSVGILDDLTIKDVELEHGNSCTEQRSNFYTKEFNSDCPMKIGQRLIKLSRRDMYGSHICNLEFGPRFSDVQKIYGKEIYKFFVSKIHPNWTPASVTREPNALTIMQPSFIVFLECVLYMVHFI